MDIKKSFYLLMSFTMSYEGKNNNILTFKKRIIAPLFTRNEFAEETSISVN